MWGLQSSLQHAETNSLTRDWTWAPSLGAPSLSHWTTKEVPALIVTIAFSLVSLPLLWLLQSIFHIVPEFSFQYMNHFVLLSCLRSSKFPISLKVKASYKGLQSFTNSSVTILASFPIPFLLLFLQLQPQGLLPVPRAHLGAPAPRSLVTFLLCLNHPFSCELCASLSYFFQDFSCMLPSYKWELSKLLYLNSNPSPLNSLYPSLCFFNINLFILIGG